MRRVNLDNAAPAIKRFVSALPVADEGVELELNGRVLCKIVPASRFSSEEMKVLVDERWRLIRAAQGRNKGVSSRVLEREVSDAVEKVRRRQRS